MLNKNVDPIVVAGIGRCGTTLLTQAIWRSRRLMSVYQKSLGKCDFERGHVYKTHDGPNITKTQARPRVIFMFGDITDVVISTSNKIDFWGKKHFEHFNANGLLEHKELYHKDILGLEELFDSWYQPQEFPLFTLRYESLYHDNTLEQLDKFLGFKVKLPPFNKRKTNQKDLPELEILKKTYASLDTKIKSAEDVKIW